VITRIVGIAVYVALGFLILAFIFSNRELVSLQLFPFATVAELPLYVALCALFATGLMLGLLHSASVWIGMQRKLTRAQRTIAQLQKTANANPTP